MKLPNEGTLVNDKSKIEYAKKNNMYHYTIADASYTKKDAKGISHKTFVNNCPITFKMTERQFVNFLYTELYITKEIYEKYSGNIPV